MSIKKLTLGMWRAMLLCEVGVVFFWPEVLVVV